MKKKKTKRERKIYRPYNFDIIYEQNTYKHIGHTYGDKYTANKGFLHNLIQSCLMKNNKNEKKFKTCNTYSEWEAHVKTVIKPDMLNYNDFLHWLKGQKRNTETFLESIKSVLIPVYIALLSISSNFYANSTSLTTRTWGTCIFSIILAVASAAILYNATENVDFYNDIIEIAEAQTKSTPQKQTLPNTEAN